MMKFTVRPNFYRIRFAVDFRDIHFLAVRSDVAALTNRVVWISFVLADNISILNNTAAGNLFL